MITDSDLHALAQISTSPGLHPGKTQSPWVKPDINEEVRRAAEKAYAEMQTRIRSKTWPKWF